MNFGQLHGLSKQFFLNKINRTMSSLVRLGLFLLIFSTNSLFSQMNVPDFLVSIIEYYILKKLSNSSIQ